MAQIMTDREKADITMRAIALEEAGRAAEALELEKSIPMPPFMAEFWKKHGKIDYFVKAGYNMAEADTAFGRDWLTR
jgi:hypothetical protein